MIAVLFDIDGTILDSRQAGAGSFYAALEATWPEHAPVSRELTFAGATDLGLLHGLLASWGEPLDETRMQAFFNRMETEMRERADPAGMVIYPGVRELIEQLHDRDDVLLGLLTGNIRSCAYLKLQTFGLGGYFDFGGFGDEHPDRREMARIALSHIHGRVPEDVLRHPVVIGDTPSDIAGARAIDARAVCVTTGQYDAETLEAEGADVVFDSLADTDAVLRAIGL